MTMRQAFRPVLRAAGLSHPRDTPLRASFVCSIARQ